MAHNHSFQTLIRLTAAVLVTACVAIGTLQAETDISSWHDDPLRLSVKFETQTSAFNQAQSYPQPSSWTTEFDNLTLIPANTKYSLDSAIVRQYDATFFFPFRHGKLNFDLGLNIKFINGIIETTDQFGVTSAQNYNATLPMMYATALYALPWKGLSAGIEGKHMLLDSSSAYDYKAMFSYQNGNGFGLNGGWQYQQLHLDAFQNITADSQSDGPFVDIFYHF